MNKHHDIEGKVIADRKNEPDLYADPNQYRQAWRNPCSKQKAQHRGQRIADRIDDRVAIIADGNRSGAIALDDEWAVLQDLPCRLEQNGQAQPSCNGTMLEDEPQQKIKPKTVQQVRE